MSLTGLGSAATPRPRRAVVSCEPRISQGPVEPSGSGLWVGTTGTLPLSVKVAVVPGMRPISTSLPAAKEV